MKKPVKALAIPSRWNENPLLSTESGGFPFLRLECRVMATKTRFEEKTYPGWLWRGVA